MYETGCRPSPVYQYLLFIATERALSKQSKIVDAFEADTMSGCGARGRGIGKGGGPKGERPADAKL